MAPCVFAFLFSSFFLVVDSKKIMNTQKDKNGSKQQDAYKMANIINISWNSLSPSKMVH